LVTRTAGSLADGELCARLRELCGRTRPALRPGPAADALDAVAARLSEPTLRIAVGGRLKAGKSTLVNALLGQRLAATAVLECTLLVAWFRYSHQNRIEVRCRNGRVYHVPGAPGGGVPQDLSVLGAPREEIAEIVVEVANQRLAADYTIVDTPGMDSLSGLDEVSMAALARADALLYVTPLPGEKDREALDDLRRMARSHWLSSANVLGVLSRVDLLGSGAWDPWPDARRVATHSGARLAGLAAKVIPVAGLLAQAALAEEFTDADTSCLRLLADTDQCELATAMFSADSFLEWDACPFTVPDRQRLLDLLGCYGILQADAAIRAARKSGETLVTADLLTILRDLSGIDEVLSHLREHFTAAADQLRATAAIGLLESAAWTDKDPAHSAALAVMRSELAELRRHPILLRAELALALVAMTSERLPLTTSQEAALHCLAEGADPASCLGLHQRASAAAVQHAADDQIGCWRALEWSRSRAVRRLARTALEMCEALYFAAEVPS
jgi:hypothetical protein